MKIEIDTNKDSYILWRKAKELIEFAYHNEESEESHIRNLKKIRKI